MAALEAILEIFSGRPNPSIKLTAPELDELRTRLKQSRQALLERRREPPKLGYRGFVIVNPKLEAGLPYRLEVFGGFVAVEEYPPKDPKAASAAPLVYQDSGRVEEWLLERAAERGYGKDIAAMGGPWPTARTAP